jgi:GMP synthase (glutamine-hydrolysing)
VLKDLHRAELGTREVHLTDEGRSDRVFGNLPATFRGQMGHEDHVVALPPGAIRLARSDRVENQAFCFPGLPLYCTQFHPELDRQALWERVEAYPEYAERIAGISPSEFIELCQETPEAASLLPHFVARVLES